MLKHEVTKRIESSLRVLNPNKLSGYLRESDVQLLLQGLPTSHAIGTTTRFIMDFSANKYLYLGKNIENITGYSQIELMNADISASIAKYMPPEQGILVSELNMQGFSKLIKEFNGRTDIYVTMDHGIVRKNGTSGRILVQLRPFVWSRGEILIAGGYYTDITHLKKEGHPIVSITCNGEVLCTFESNLKTVLRDKLTDFTARELEILALTGSGFSTKEIARKTGLTVGTIYAHRRNVLSKSEYGSIAKLVESLKGRGILSLSSFSQEKLLEAC